jgi:hypothetical protein
MVGESGQWEVDAAAAVREQLVARELVAEEDPGVVGWWLLECGCLAGNSLLPSWKPSVVAFAGCDGELV